MRRRKEKEEKFIIAVPAWLVRLEGMREQICVDSYFIFKVKDPIRRILFMYPEKECEPYPLSGAYIVKSDVRLEDVLKSIGDGCEEARKRLARIPRQRFLLRALPLTPSAEERSRAEAHYANELCNSIFAKDPRNSFLVNSRRSFINYIIGERLERGPSARIVKVSSIDKGVLEALSDIINEVKKAFKTP